MFATIFQMKRDNLYKEIIDELRKWPDLERKIFSQAHYCGQSPESIAKSLQLDLESVNAILKSCDHRLHVSLRNPAKDKGSKPLPAQAENVRPDANRQDREASLGQHPLGGSQSPLKKVAV